MMGVPTALFMEDYNTKDEFCICPANSSTETASNLPGAGRTLGNVYSSLGRLLEEGLGTLAHKLGQGPRAKAKKILNWTFE